jgi:tetratricopeptide (TPR) repeat protein
VRVEFVYGAAVFETEPAGARVTTPDGTEWGTTPQTLAELAPGMWQFVLHRAEYEPVQVSLEVRANETNSVHTNLVNSTFASALVRGESALKSHQYHDAVIALTEALQHTQGDDRATRLLHQAQVGEALESAEKNAVVGDYHAALKQIEMALAISPDSERAKQLAADYRKVMADAEAKAKAEQAASERAGHPKQYFDHLMQSTVNSPLFDEQTVRAIGKVADVEKKVVFALTNQAPVFKLSAHENPDSDTFFISAGHGIGLGGRRRVDVVVGQSTDIDVFIIFKVFEYGLPADKSLQALVGKIADKDMVPIHSSRLSPNDQFLLSRRAEGIRLVRDRIQKAVGE